MKSVHWLRSVCFSLAVAGVTGQLAQAQPRVQPTPTNVQLLDKALDQAPDSPRVAVDDMLFPRAKFLAYRNSVAAVQQSGRTTRSAFYSVPRWPGGLVYYSFAANLPTAQRTAFTEACREWEKWVNVKFAPRTNQANFIRVYQDASDGSFSEVGMIGGAQDMSLASWATKWTACHELAHALGAIHEQSRSDRDSYVTINFANIQSGLEDNFAIVADSQNKGSYDFDSLMHYPNNGFAIDVNQYTIIAKPNYSQYQHTMGQRDHLSTRDKAGMVAVYGAPVTSAPANDPFANATTLTGNAGTVTGTNAYATKQSGEPNHAGSAGGASVWYKWTAPASGNATITTTNSGFDTLLAVYTGSSVGALTAVASNDDANSNVSTSAVSFSAVAGKTYFIAVDGYKGVSGVAETGNLTLKWSAPASTTTYSLGGTVATSSGALSGVTLSLGGAKTATTTSSSTGTYSFTGLAAGAYTLTPSKAGYTFSPTSRSYNLSGNVTGAMFMATPTASLPTVSISSVSSVEGDAGAPYMTFNMMLSAPSSQTVTVNYTTVNGSALAGSDYTAQNGTLTFKAGATMADIRINLLPDRVVEGNETFSVVLSNPVGAKLKIATGKGTLVNDDSSNDVPEENDGRESFDPSAPKG